MLKCLSKMVDCYTGKVGEFFAKGFDQNFFSPQATFLEQVLELGQKAVHNTHHGVRVECLKLIGQVCHVTAGVLKTPLDILEEHCVDPDPRVRSAAFQALVRVKALVTSIVLIIGFFSSFRCTLKMLMCCHYQCTTG